MKFKKFKKFKKRSSVDIFLSSNYLNFITLSDLMSLVVPIVRCSANGTLRCLQRRNLP
jgi:hypothetical protein